MKAAYIHIPFCQHICSYCDFNKFFIKNQPVDEYIQALESEMQLTLKQTPTNYLETIFVGGGTPTALTVEQLEKLTHIIKSNLPYDEHTEFTFEANPQDLTIEKLQVLKNAGVNRISIGVQTFNEQLLKDIGRTHSPAEVFEAIENTKKIGFENISIDLIYSLPNQTIEDFKHTLKTAFSLGITHFSGYSLILEPKTIFYNLYNQKRLSLPPEETETAMYDLLMEEMEAHGYKQYEISNFALEEKYQSRHNLTYWKNEEYYGFGAGAHSYVAEKRISNHGPLKKYMEDLSKNELPYISVHEVTIEEKMEEEMFLGLRTIKGVSLEAFERKFGKDLLVYFKDAIESSVKRQLLEVVDGHVRLTRKGRFLGNEVFVTFLQ